MRARLSEGDLVAGRYQLRAAHAEGPAWVGYRALDRDAEVELALWWMRRELFPDEARRHRFLGAVVELRGVNHPGLRRMFEAGEDGAGLWATAQLDAGPALPPPGARLGIAELHALAAPLAAGLTAAHQAGLVHGRLVPDDLVLVARQPKIGGVGLYRDVDRVAARSLWMRWERYLAPEVVAGGAASPPSDVWSLAVMLAELAAGGPVADGREALAAVRSVDRALADALAPALVAGAERRLESPAALLDRLGALLDRGELELPASDDPLFGEQGPPTSRDARPESWGEPITVDTAADSADDSLASTWIGGEDAAATTPGQQAEPSAVPLPLAAPPLTPVPPRNAPAAVPAAVPASSQGEGAHVGAPPLQAVAVSHKPKSEPGGKPAPTIARDVKPVLRPISSAAPPPPANLGRYAPPAPVGQRASGSQRIPRRGRPWLWIGITAGAALALIAVAVAVWASRRDRTEAGSPQSADDDRPAVVKIDAGPAPRPAAPASPCPAGMVPVDDTLCIDSHEAPGKGHMPESGLTLADAVARCQAHGARLCTEQEWERGCRGPDGASWPYGTAFRRGTCNVLGGGVAITGSFPECRSAAGAYDMSGNVAEWVAEGWAKGSSTDDRGDGRCSRNQKRSGGGGQGFADVGFRCCAGARR